MTNPLTALTPASMDAWLAPFADTAVVGQAWNGCGCPLARLLAHLTGERWSVYLDHNGRAVAARTGIMDDPQPLPEWCGPVLTAVDDLGAHCALQTITAGALREILARCRQLEGVAA
jgi:hypothetical protein